MTTASDLVELAGRLLARAEMHERRADGLRGVKPDPSREAQALDEDAAATTLREAASALRERIPLPADGGAREALERVSELKRAVVNVVGQLDTWLMGSQFTKPKAGQIILHVASVERLLGQTRLALHPSSRGEAEQK